MTYATLIATPIIVCLFWVIIYLLNYRGLNRSQKILTVLGVSYMLGMFDTVIFLSDPENFRFYFAMCVMNTSLFSAPIMYLYFRSLTDSKPFKAKDFHIFILPCIIQLLYYVHLIVSPDDGAMKLEAELCNLERAGLRLWGVMKEFSRLGQYSIVIRIYNILYYTVLYANTLFTGIYAIIKTHRYTLSLKDYYSDTENKSIACNYRVMCFLIAALFLASSSFGRGVLNDHIQFAALLGLAQGVALFGAFFNAFKATFTVQDFVKDQEQSAQLYEKVPVVEREKVSFSEGDVLKLERYVEETRPYLNAELKVDDLAAGASLNRTRLSNIIKARYNCNFSTYICNLRIEHAKQVMRDNPDMKYEAVALDSGFKHVESFYRSFKQQTGLTPTQWATADKTTPNR